MTDALQEARKSLTRSSLDHCVKCTICDTQCPVLRVTDLFSGPKYVGPQAERFRHGESVDRTLDYCSGCGICTWSCPQGVKIAEINGQARALMKEGHMPLRDRLITQTDLMGKAMTPVAPIANAALGVAPLRTAMEKVVGIHREAAMPTAQTQSFMGWWKKREKPTRRPTRGPVVFFHGCAGGYFEVETSKQTVEVLEHLGYEVLVPDQNCCGLASQSNGMFNQATRSVLKLCDALISSGRDLPIVSSSGSCAGQLRHEAREIMGVDDPRLQDVGTRTMETAEFLLELHHRGELPVEELRRFDSTLVYHQPCQLKSQGIGMPAIELMELIPGVQVRESDEVCCGMAGTYGLKEEKYDVARRVGEPLFDKIRETNPHLAVCETETCRWHIAKHSGAMIVHPVALLHQAYGLGTQLPS